MNIDGDSIHKDLENILKRVALSENLKNYEVFSNNNQIQGEGFSSEIFTGEVLNTDNDKTIQVAIKKAPIDGFNGGPRYEVVFKNEINFYSQVFPELDKFQKENKVKLPFDHIPRYFAGNIKSENIFIAMENLQSAGYVLFDKKKYLDREHLEFIFKTYGKWHALSFVLKHKNAEGYANLVKNLTNLMVEFNDISKMVTLIEKGFLVASETFDPITEADILGKFKKIDTTEITKRLQAYKGSYQCLCHGDCWSNNMLFKYKASGELEDIKLIDFQASYSNTPIYDLSYFFYSGASKKDMDKLDYYLDVYYQSFSNFAKELGGNPDEIFPLEILKTEWKQYGTWGIFFGFQLWLVKLMDREEIIDVLQQKGLTEVNYWELWTEKMNKIYEGADYRQRVRNICLHAIEYGIL